MLTELLIKEKKMLFQTFNEFETTMDKLFNQEKYEEADKYMENHIKHICNLTCPEDIHSYLSFYASVARDHESMDRFERLFNKLVALKKINTYDILEYRKILPANR